MSRKAWLHPRKKKLISPSIRTTKKGGIQIVKAHEHEYPNKLKPADKIKKNKKEDRLATSKRKKNTDDAKKEMACRMGA